MMKPRRIGIVAIEGVQLLDVAGPADVFAEANVRAGRTEYEVRVLAVTPGTIGASSGMRLTPDDVLSPSELARKHSVYRCRVQMSVGFRADCWAALEHDTSLTAAALARKGYAPFATAWQVKRDFAVACAGGSSSKSGDATVSLIANL